MSDVATKRTTNNIVDAKPATAETASSLLAAKAEAEMKARYALAVGRQRDEAMARERILAACRRPRFADAALYKRPVGGGKTIRGLSVRFAEQVAQYWGNLYQSAHTIFDDDEKRIIHCSVTDLETNASVGQDIVIEKYVERRQPREGDDVMSSRTNSMGQTVYRIRANDDALLMKTNNVSAKLFRSQVLRLIPADIKEEAVDACIETVRRSDQKNPTTAKSRILDAFASIGVEPHQLKAYVGKPIDALTAEELTELRAIYVAIDSGEATWRDYVAVADAGESALVKRGDSW